MHFYHCMKVYIYGNAGSTLRWLGLLLQAQFKKKVLLNFFSNFLMYYLERPYFNMLSNINALEAWLKW